MTKPIQLTAQLSYWRDDMPEMPETLALELTAEQVAAIEAARRFIIGNPHIHTVNLRCEVPQIEDWPHDVCYLIIHPTVGSYLFLQGKYDCSEQVEYSVEI